MSESSTNEHKPADNEFQSHGKFESKWPHHRHSAVWPLVLIAIGVIFLLKNFDLISTRVISNMVKLWPLILVYLGLDYWTRSNPRIRTIVTILFISGVVFAILLLSDQSAAFWR